MITLTHLIVKMKTPILSIVIPVYQAEKFLPDCLDSILYTGKASNLYEVILIDDGSDDSCPDICDQYAAAYSNIRVIHQTNNGVAHARNVGVIEAKGMYTAFVDSDDTIEMSKLLSVIEDVQSTSVDVACFGYYIYSETGILIRKEKARHASHTLITGLDFLQQQKDFKGYIWRYLFNTKYIQNFSFQEDLRWSEDDEWIQKVLINASNVRIFDTYIYNYFSRCDSLTHSYQSNTQAIIDTKFRLIAYYLKTVTPETKKWYNYAIGVVVESILTITGKYTYTQHKEIIEKLESFHTGPYTLRYCTFVSAIKFLIINLSPNLYCFIRHCK